MHANRTRMERCHELQMYRIAEIYSEYECLWDPTNPLYRNRMERESAYQEIADKLNIPGVSGRDIPKKIGSLRSSYYYELNKIDKSIQHFGNATYTPKVSWFAIVDKLLCGMNNKQDTISNTADNSKTSDNDSETNNTYQVNCSTELIFPTEEFKVEEHSNPSDEENNIEDNNFVGVSNADESLASTSSRFPVPYEKPLKHREKTHKVDQGIRVYNKEIAEIDEIANRVMPGFNSREEKQVDEFDVYGKYIAAVLRSLPADTAVRAKLSLQKCLADLQLSEMIKGTNRASSSK